MSPRAAWLRLMPQTASSPIGSRQDGVVEADGERRIAAFERRTGGAVRGGDESLLVVAPVDLGPLKGLVSHEVAGVNGEGALVLDECFVALELLRAREVGIEGVDIHAEQAGPEVVVLVCGNEDSVVHLSRCTCESATEVIGRVRKLVAHLVEVAVWP